MLILPGADTWELWQVGAQTPSKLLTKTETRLLPEVSSIPTGLSAVVFPINQLTFAPLSVNTKDESLFLDLVVAHWEQLGVKLNTQEGILNDYGVISLEENNSLIAPYVLNPQREQDLPSSKINYFDISPRVYMVTGDMVVLKQELGKWVLIIYRQGMAIYAQLLGDVLTSESLRDIQLCLWQLSMQGCCSPSYPVEIWLSEEQLEDSMPILESSPFALKITRKLIPKPQLPVVWSKLLPADVGAERREHIKNRRMVVIGTLIGLCYLSIVGICYKNILNLESDIKKVQLDKQELAEPAGKLESVQAQWDTLAPAIDSSLWTDDLLWRCYNARPDGNTVRFTYFEVIGNETTGKPETIIIKGVAPKPEDITKLGQRLKSSAFKLQDYQWNTPSPVPGEKGKSDWTFSYEAKALDTLAEENS